MKINKNDFALLRSIIADHFDNPDFKDKNGCSDKTYNHVHMNSTSCIDDIEIWVKLNDNVINDIKFNGKACAICTSSTDIISSLIINKTIEEANLLIDNYLLMIQNKEHNEDMLGEAIAFSNVHKLAHRIKCATLGAKGFKKILTNPERKEHEQENIE